MHLDVTHGEGRIAVDEVSLRQSRASPPQYRKRAVCDVHRDAELAREGADAADMILVLVRHQDAVELLGEHAQPRESGHDILQPKAAIEQEPRVARFDDESVAVTATAERRKAHHAR